MSPTLLEIIRLRNARTVNCVFCKSVRYEIARQDGLTEERAAMVDAGYRESALRPEEKLAIALADGYLGYPAGIPAELGAQLQAAFSPAQLVSLLLALMSFNFTSRTAVSIGGMPAEPPPVTVLPLSGTAD